ncbi:threonine/serine exporter family protein [Faecalimonas sp.]
MKDEQLMETAMLAGEIMLCSGAETYRVEDTMSHILKNADAEQKEVLVMMTGIMASLKKEGQKPSTLIKRVTDRGTNLNRVMRVNEVSRKLCSGEVTAEEAYKELKHIASGRYKEFTSPLYHFFATVIAVIGFTMMFGGKVNDIWASAIVGAILGISMEVGRKLEVHDFVMDAISSMVITVFSVLLKAYLPVPINMDTIIISAIMPLVPGVAITNAVRDTLQGDYITGGSRMLEAFIKAASIALGVGIGMMLFGSKFIGRTVL